MIDNKVIEEVKKRLVDAFDPVAIYLFGSYAWVEQIRLPVKLFLTKIKKFTDD